MNPQELALKVSELNAEEMQIFFDFLREYFANAEEITNFDATGIACHLSDCQDILQNRTNN